MKSNTVNLEGKFCLNSITPQNIVRNKGNLVKTNQKPRGEHTAQIVQKDDNFAIIEISCSCGQKILLKCDHGSQSSTDKQKNKTEVSNIKEE